MELIRDLNYTKFSDSVPHHILIISLIELPPLDGDLLVNLLNVPLGARAGEVLSFKDSSIDELAPVLSHLLFVGDSQKLTDKLRIDSYDFNQLVP